MADVKMWEHRLATIAKLDKAAQDERENAKDEAQDRAEDFAIEERKNG